MTQDVGQLVDAIVGEFADSPKLGYARAGLWPAEVLGPPRLNAFDRMFTTNLGAQAVNVVGNEGQTLSIIDDFATELLLDAIRLPHRKTDSMIFRRGPGKDAVLLLDPSMPKQDGVFRVTDEFSIDLLAAAKAGEEKLAIAAGYHHGIFLGSRFHRQVAGMLLAGGPEAMAQILWISQPEILRAPTPEMEELCCPSPALAIRCERPDGKTHNSSVGIFCSDINGEPGVTAALHGTGPTGTKVTLGGLPAEVKRHSEIQDLVFIPLPQGYAVPAFRRGTAGPRRNGEPARNDPVSFEGCTNQTSTVVSATSSGLLWIDPLSQSKVETPAVVDRGDSGCALVDSQDQILGFAFRRTKYDAPIQWAEWIWAANALATLELKAI